MKNHIYPISFIFLLLPFNNLESSKHLSPVKETSTSSYFFSGKTEASILYDELELSELGLSEKAFEYAYRGYISMVEKRKVKNNTLLTIADLSQSSSKKRLYIIDMENNRVMMNTYVAHGRGSGGEFATRFSNKASSHQSSLGFYVTGNTYYGQHGLSLRLNGVESGINNQAQRRNIVVHGASYIGEKYLVKSKYMGRSYGCPAVPKEESSKIIELIEGGTCLFIYHPSKKYFQQSKLLND